MSFHDYIAVQPTIGRRLTPEEIERKRKAYLKKHYGDENYTPLKR